MNVLMYPLGPDDDFPEMFCAIRQGSGEHWFYTPVGEDASWMLFRAESENAKLRDELDAAKHDLSLFSERIVELGAENAKLRESLDRAAGIIADICGECPVSRYEWLSSDGCAEKCGTVTEEECWIAYLAGKRWDESGAEVDR